MIRFLLSDDRARLTGSALLAGFALLGSPLSSSQTPPGETPAVASPARAPAAAGVMDKVQLEASRITGNRELPRVLYIVPWRQPGAAEVDGQPMNSLLYELTGPVDRDVLRREARYHAGLASRAELRDRSQPQR